MTKAHNMPENTEQLQKKYTTRKRKQYVTHRTS